VVQAVVDFAVGSFLFLALLVEETDDFPQDVGAEAQLVAVRQVDAQVLAAHGQQDVAGLLVLEESRRDEVVDSGEFGLS